MQLSLKEQLHYARFVQLTIVLTFGLWMYLFTTIPHNWWIFLTVMMMMSAIQPGLILVKSIHRGKGTIVGLVFSFVLVYVLHLNYRLVSVVFIASMIFINIPNQRRYDLTVMSMTIMIFINDSYSYRFPLLEGPIEVAINRITCTIIGIAICIASDYFLFNRFNYSGKVYRILQDELVMTVEKHVHEVSQVKCVRKNNLILMKNIRDTFNNVFGQISSSAEGILHSSSSSEELKQLVRNFSEISWKLRIEVSALYIAYCILDDDSELVERHTKKLVDLLKQAKDNLLVL